MKMQVNGEKIKQLREQKCWSQQQLSEMAGLSTRTLQRLEAKSAASQETIKSIAAVFEVDCATLIPASDINQPTSNTSTIDTESIATQVPVGSEANAIANSDFANNDPKLVTEKKQERRAFFIGIFCVIASICFGFYGVFDAHEANRISSESFRLLSTGLSIALLLSIIGAVFSAYRKGIISKSDLL